MKKDSHIHIKVVSAEKEGIRATARARGFESISAYLLYLHRTQPKPRKTTLSGAEIGRG